MTSLLFQKRVNISSSSKIYINPDLDLHGKKFLYRNFTIL